MAVYLFTRQELKNKNGSDFKDGDFIRVGKYGIHIHYEDGDYKYDTPSNCSFVENLNTGKLLDYIAGIDIPYYIDDFLKR